MCLTSTNQPGGSITGFEVELIDAVCVEMQRECKWI